MGKVIRFPGTPSTGPLLDKDLNVVCPQCGNTEVFFFRIFAFPYALVEKRAKGKYVASEFFYDQDGTVGEMPLLCARCGYEDLEITAVDKERTRTRKTRKRT